MLSFKRLLPLLILLLLFGSARAELPPYSGAAFIALDEPVFDLSGEDPQVRYFGFDALGRPLGAEACVTAVSAESRGNIGGITPPGYTGARYDFIDGRNLYQRCHLLAHALGGDDADYNLFTGTQHLNQGVMLQIEGTVAEYVRGTGRAMYYRVLPVYEGDELVPRAVDIAFAVAGLPGQWLHVCAYNVQPGVLIDYRTGASDLAPFTALLEDAQPVTRSALPLPDLSAGADYVLNTNTHKFHYPDCASVADIKPKNYKAFHGTRDEALSLGYAPCKRCNP